MSGLCLLGCSHKSTPTPTATNEVTPAGGTVTASDGTSVVVPAGAVGQSTPISVGGETNSVSIDDADLVGDVYRFGPEGMQFSVPVTLTLPYDPSKLPDGATAEDIVIMTAPVGSTTFTEMATTVVDANHVSTTTMHFSDFVATVRKNKKGDLAMSPADQGASDDLAMSEADLSSPPDMANMCVHTFTSANCTLAASTMNSCSGNYTLNCQQTMCQCYALNMGSKFCPKQGADANTTNCPGQAAMEVMWTTCCMFP